MKTFRTIIITTLVVAVAFGGALLGFALNEGIVKVSKIEENHTKTVIIDGVEQSNTSWTEVLGYTVSIDVVDSTYIGK